MKKLLAILALLGVAGLCTPAMAQNKADKAAPAATAPAGETIGIASGHVGMIVGSTRTQLHETLRLNLPGS